MYDMLQTKVDRLAGKTYLVEKYLKTAFFCGKKSASAHFGMVWRLSVDTRSIFGVPLKTLGYNGFNWLLRRSVVLKLSLQQADELFLQMAMEIREKQTFFLNRSDTKNCQ